MTRRTSLGVTCLLAVALGALPAAARDAGAAASIDGPYVFLQDGKREQLRVRRNDQGVVEATRSALAGAEVEVEVDSAGAHRFEVPLRKAHPRGATHFPMPSRLLVASDLEGQFDAFTSLMQHNGVLDARLHWRFGRGHLVLVGDLVDRGPHVLPLLWLVYRMEAEARAAGGAVHYVLGNHEQMLLTGQTRYQHPKYLETLRLTGQAPQALWDEHSELGRWLRSKPVLLRVGDYLFMHGGLSPEALALRPTLDEVDRLAATSLTRDPRELTDARAKAVIRGPLGVLWYRGLAMDMPGIPRATPAQVQQVLQHFGVRHLVIGHTLVEHVGSDYGGAVLRVDVGHAAGTREALLIERGKAFRVDASGQRGALEQAVNAD
ncbi:phosphatase [Aggregicoccus sp. 17bor-14]|uniref:metallophosphoesterase n=1 Tax=Myxococcaceae TaxID=31 RepID=UPI00129C3549|nr:MULTISPECIES: metallophosphoesterase [Myxococcaceae]MBF5042249.1 metallophosphoesterase [Simulacricoccus sp. 17bor-14]MRI88024.1 phosphatase [Aggregicoccus sp. 17bor-14]